MHKSGYTFANKRKVGEVLPWPQEASPLRTSYLRAPGQVGTTFGGESFIDEVAAALRVDPVAFRLRYIKEPRAVAVIQAAARQAGWVSRPSPRPNLTRAGLAVGRGIAYAPRKDTRVATVAEVEVNQATGRVYVTRLVTAPAIANAIFDATGARIRTAPFTPDRVKAALAQRPA